MVRDRVRTQINNNRNWTSAGISHSATMSYQGKPEHFETDVQKTSRLPPPRISPLLLILREKFLCWSTDLTQSTSSEVCSDYLSLGKTFP